jgi:hypothetical protein
MWKSQSASPPNQRSLLRVKRQQKSSPTHALYTLPDRLKKKRPVVRSSPGKCAENNFLMSEFEMTT